MLVPLPHPPDSEVLEIGDGDGAMAFRVFGRTGSIGTLGLPRLASEALLQIIQAIERHVDQPDAGSGLLVAERSV